MSFLRSVSHTFENVENQVLDVPSDDDDDDADDGSDGEDDDDPNVMGNNRFEHQDRSDGEDDDNDSLRDDVDALLYSEGDDVPLALQQPEVILQEPNNNEDPGENNVQANEEDQNGDEDLFNLCRVCLVARKDPIALIP